MHGSEKNKEYARFRKKLMNMHGSGKNQRICTDLENIKEYARIWKKIKNMHGS